MSIGGRTGRELFGQKLNSYMRQGTASTEIRVLRKNPNRPWGPRELGRESKMDPSRIGAWLSGKNKPSEGGLRSICHVLFGPEGKVDSEKERLRSELFYLLDQWDNIVVDYTNFSKPTRDADPLEGKYVYIRPTFDRPEFIAAFDVSFVFSAESNRVEFRRTDNAEARSDAWITRPNLSPHFEIIESRPDGFNSLTICTFPDEDGIINGVILTMGMFSKNAHLPSIAPIAFIEAKSDLNYKFGVISPDSDEFENYNKALLASRDRKVFLVNDIFSEKLPNDRTS